MAGLVLLAGCRPSLDGPADPVAEADRQRPYHLDTTGPNRGRQVDRIVVVQMQFDVLCVELPIDRTRHSAKIWNHVDELRIEPARAALLRRNGLRIGAASADSWPALRAIFESCQAKTLRATHTVRQGLPLVIEVGQVEPDETVFLHTADHRMIGRTLSEGHKYLHLDYQLSPDPSATTTLQVTPEIHALSKEKRWQNQGGALQKVPEYTGRLFHELGSTVDIAAGEFLVIGPDAAQATDLTVGRRFLTRRLQGRTYEIVLCITPQPFRTEPARD